MLCQGVNGRGAPQGDPKLCGWALVTELVTLTGMEHVILQLRHKDPKLYS